MRNLQFLLFYFEDYAFAPLANYIVVMTTTSLHAVCVRPARPPEISINKEANRS